MATVRRLQAVVEADGVSSFSSEMDAARGSLIDFRTAVGGTGLALAGLAAGGFAVAINEARKFQDSMVELEKVTNPETARQMSDAIKEMATTIPLAQTALADIAADAGRFGVRGPKNIRSFTEAVAKMATATDLNATQAGEALAKLAQLTGTPIPKVENLGSAINELSNNFATSSSEIVDSMLRSSAAMSQFGLSQTEIAGFSAALNEVSESAERAGTRLRRLVQEIMNPKKVHDLARALGMNVQQFKQMQKNNPAKLLTMMAKRMKEGGKSADILNTTLSTTSRQALAGLGQNLNGLNQALGMSADAFRENTSLQKEFEKASQTFNAQLQLLINRLRNVAISIGSVLLPPLTKLLSILGDAVSAFTSLNARLDGMLGPMMLLSTLVVGLTAAWNAFAGTAAVATLTTIAAAVGSLLVPIALLTAATTALAIAWKRDFGGIRSRTMRTLGTIQSRIQSFISWLEGRWATFTTNLSLWWSKFSDGIVDDAMRAMNLVKAAFGTGLQILKAIWKGDTQAILSLWNHMLSQLKFAAATGMIALRDAIIFGLTAIIMSANSTFDQFPTRLAFAFQDMVNVAVSGFKSILLEFLGFKKASRDSWKTTMAAWENLTKTHMPKIRTAVQGGLNTVRGKIKSFKSRVLTIWRGIWPLLPKPVQNAAKKIDQFFGNAIRGLLKDARKTVNGIIRGFRSVNKQLGKILGPIVTKIKGIAKQFGFLDKQGRLTKQGLKTVGKALFSLATGPMGKVISTAITLHDKWKQNVGGIKGITRRTFNAVRNIITQAATQIRTQWNQNGNRLVTQTRTTLNTIKTVFKNGIAAIPAAITGVLNALSLLWQHTGRNWVTTIRTVSNTIKNVVRGLAQALGQIFNGLVIPLLNRVTVFWRQHGDDIMLIVGALVVGVSEAIRNLMNIMHATIVPTLNALATVWNAFGDELIVIIRVVADVIISLIGTLIDTIATLIRAGMAAMEGDWSTAWNHMAGLMERILNGIISFVTRWGGGLVNEIRGAIEGAINAFIDFGSRLIFGSIIPNIFNSILSFVRGWDFAGAVRGAVNSGLDAIRGLAGDFRNAGANLLSGFVDGVQSKVDDVRNAVSGVVGAARGLLPGSDAKEGPLSDLTASGAAFPATFAEGILGNQRPVRRAMLETVRPPTPEVRVKTPRNAPAQQPVTNNNININVRVPKGTDVDTAARTVADELKSRGFN